MKNTNQTIFLDVNLQSLFYRVIQINFVIDRRSIGRMLRVQEIRNLWWGLKLPCISKWS